MTLTQEPVSTQHVFGAAELLNPGGYESRARYDPWISLYFDGPAFGRFWTDSKPTVSRTFVWKGAGGSVTCDEPAYGKNKYTRYEYELVAIDRRRKIASWRLVKGA